MVESVEIDSRLLMIHSPKRHQSTCCCASVKKHNCQQNMLGFDLLFSTRLCHHCHWPALLPTRAVEVSSLVVAQCPRNSIFSFPVSPHPSRGKENYADTFWPGSDSANTRLEDQGHFPTAENFDSEGKICRRKVFFRLRCQM